MSLIFRDKRKLLWMRKPIKSHKSFLCKQNSYAQLTTDLQNVASNTFIAPSHQIQFFIDINWNIESFVFPHPTAINVGVQSA